MSTGDSQLDSHDEHDEHSKRQRILRCVNVQPFLGFLFLLLCMTESKNAYN
jgi:hypothetical protein